MEELPFSAIGARRNSDGSKANLLPCTPAGCVPEGDWTVIGKYTASSSVVNATLVYNPYNLATPIAGL